MFNRFRSKEALRMKYQRQIQESINRQYIPAVMMHRVEKVLQNARRSMPQEVQSLRSYANSVYRAKQNRQSQQAAARQATMRRNRSPVRRAPSFGPLNHLPVQMALARAPSPPRTRIR